MALTLLVFALPLGALDLAPGTLPDFEAHCSHLLVQASQPFLDDPLREVETNLDRLPFDQLNRLACPGRGGMAPQSYLWPAALRL